MISKRNRRLVYAYVAVICMVPTNLFAQQPGPERGAIVAAIKSVAEPDQTGQILVSTPFGNSDDATIAAAVAAELGGVARTRSQAIVCKTDSNSPRGECQVVGGQFIEVHQMTNFLGDKDLILEVRTFVGKGRIVRRSWMVTLSEKNGKWSVKDMELIEIT